MTSEEKWLTEALTRADPARADLPPAKGSMRYNSILEAAMNTEADRDTRPATLREPSRPRRRSRRRMAFAFGGAAVVLAGAVVGLTLYLGAPGGIGGITPTLAAEAVKRAAADTDAAGQSGVIETTLADNGERVITRRFSWNGEDFAILAGQEASASSYYHEFPSEIRYVDGRFYEKGYFEPTEDEQWHHYTKYDNGGGDFAGPNAANTDFVPAQILSDSRSALLGSGLMELVSSVSGLTQSSFSDGRSTYAGTLTAAALLAHDLGLSGVPFAGQPLAKIVLADSETPVTVEVTVGAGGLIEAATLNYQFEDRSWKYSVTYSQLGSAPAIAVPDPAQTVTAAKPGE